MKYTFFCRDFLLVHINNNILIISLINKITNPCLLKIWKNKMSENSLCQDKHKVLESSHLLGKTTFIMTCKVLKDTKWPWTTRCSTGTTKRWRSSIFDIFHDCSWTWWYFKTNYCRIIFVSKTIVHYEVFLIKCWCFEWILLHSVHLPITSNIKLL